MFSADQVNDWNRRYERVPYELRSHVILWPLLFIGAINLALTIAIRFPFGLLLLLAIIAIAAIRIPYVSGWIEATSPEGPHRVQIKNAEWIHHVNVSYDSMTEMQRFWVLPVVLITAGAINMALTIAAGFPFGLLFLLALLAMVAIRAPYVHGMVPDPNGGPRLAMNSAPPIEAAAPLPPVIAHEPSMAAAPAVAAEEPAPVMAIHDHGAAMSGEGSNAPI